MIPRVRWPAWVAIVLAGLAIPLPLVLGAIAQPSHTADPVKAPPAVASWPEHHRYRCKKGHLVFLTGVPSYISQITDDDEIQIRLCPVCLRAALKRLETEDQGVVP